MVDILKENFLLKINNIDLSHNISSYVLEEYDIQTANTGRNEAGDTNYERVKSDEPKLSIKWTHCDSAFKNKIKSATADGVIYITFVDDDGGEDFAANKKFYRGNRRFTMTSDINDVILWDIECNFVGME
jgi:hypothetical protein